uniref:ATP synthase F0 subunit 8 n=1 Tax=Sternaspis sendalli TaxID=2607893 RepID=UPI00226CBC61|nr:ATP synthase F0 subunit 8 [Sternaspis sendalli]UZP47199.1 ATP synthase F0 subunit 8 [Sternaspis sendalli]
MPHISPILWTQSFFIFWALLISILLLFWWHCSPQFPKLGPRSTQPSSNKWKWN